MKYRIDRVKGNGNGCIGYFHGNMIVAEILPDICNPGKFATVFYKNFQYGAILNTTSESCANWIEEVITRELRPWDIAVEFVNE